MASTLNDEIVQRFQQLDPAERKHVLNTLQDIVAAEMSFVLEDDEQTHQARLAARERMSGMIKDDITDASMTIKQGVRDYMRRKYGDIDR